MNIGRITVKKRFKGVEGADRPTLKTVTVQSTLEKRQFINPL